MVPTFIPLSAGTLDRALALRRQLYLHEDLTYDEGDAAALLLGFIAAPEFGGLWLIEAEGAVCGYLLLTICYSLEFGGRFGLLDEFYIDAPWRGQGIGGAALEFVEAQCRARRLGAIRLEVSHSNPRALELYSRTGFSIDPRHLMTKWL